MTPLLQNRNAIVTGASKGLGVEIAMALAEAGASLAILGRDTSGLETTKRKIERLGQNCICIQADLRDESSIKAACEQILAFSPTWDILVNNAGTNKPGFLLDLTADDWDEIYKINLRAAFLLSKLIVPQMIERRSGKIINISSVGTFYGTPGIGAYAASKAGMNQLTQTMAVEWGENNIQINAVCPTIILTDMGKLVWDAPEKEQMRKKILNRIPLHRFALPKEISDLVVFLSGSGSNFMNGCIIPVDDGARLNPN